MALRRRLASWVVLLSVLGGGATRGAAGPTPPEAMPPDDWVQTNPADANAAAAGETDRSRRMLSHWREASDPMLLPLPVVDAAVSEHDGHLVLLGGMTESLEATPAIQILSPRHGWLPIGSRLLRPRAGALAVPIDERRLLLLGGWQGRRHAADERWHDGGEILDPLVAGSSASIPPFGTSLEGASATRLADGSVLVAAGALLRRFDPGTALWSDPLELPHPHRHHAAIGIDGWSVLLLGGDGEDHRSAAADSQRADAAGTASSRLVRWCPHARSLSLESAVPEVPNPLAAPAIAAIGPSGPWLLLGGCCPRSGRSRAETWWLDGPEAPLRPGPPLPEARGALGVQIATRREGIVILGGEWRGPGERGASNLALLLRPMPEGVWAWWHLEALPDSASHRMAHPRSDGATELLGGYRFNAPAEAATRNRDPGVELLRSHHRLVLPPAGHWD